MDSFSRSVHLDRSTEAEGSTPSAIRRPPLPTTYLPKTPLLRNNARARDVHLTKAAPPQLRQCERVTSDGLTVGLLPNWLSVKERRAIRSPLKYVSHQTMLFWENLFTLTIGWACPKHTQANKKSKEEIYMHVVAQK